VIVTLAVAVFSCVCVWLFFRLFDDAPPDVEAIDTSPKRVEKTEQTELQAKGARQ